MFGAVIVPLDGSAHAELALPYAVSEARHHGAVLHLVQVVPRPEARPDRLGHLGHGGPAPAPLAWPAEEIGPAEWEAHRYLHDVRARCGLDPGTVIAVLVGDPVARLSAHAAGQDRPLLVMTTGDVADGSRTPLSEVARRLMVTGGVPILAVRRAADPAPAG